MARVLKDRLIELDSMSGDQAAIELVKGTLEHSPLVMFCLLPVYAMLLQIVFIRTRWLYVDHLVFALHVHSVWFLCITLALFIPDTLALVLMCIPPVYTVLALQHAYDAGWLATLVRAAILGMTYAFALTLGVVAAIGLGVMFG